MTVCSGACGVLQGIELLTNLFALPVAARSYFACMFVYVHMCVVIRFVAHWHSYSHTRNRFLSKATRPVGGNGVGVRRQRYPICVCARNVYRSFIELSGIASTSSERQTNWQKHGALAKGVLVNGTTWTLLACIHAPKHIYIHSYQQL